MLLTFSQLLSFSYIKISQFTQVYSLMTSFFKEITQLRKQGIFLLSKLSKVVCCLKYGVKINDDVERKFFSGKRSVEKWVRCKQCFFPICRLALCLKITEKVSFNIASEEIFVYILSFTRLVSFYRTKLGGNCQYLNATFWVIFEHCAAGSVCKGHSFKEESWH